MPEVRSGGPVPYVYVCTRMRYRKSKLIPKEDYYRMLNMSIPEITRIIEETQYKKEIDELSPFFHGADLLEHALSWNLAKEFQNVQQITPGVLKSFVRSYLRKWDIQNVLGILRGKAQGMKQGKIREVLVPAGELDRIFLDRLLKEDSPERILEALRGKSVYPVIAAGYAAALEKESFSDIENELYKDYYLDLLAVAGGGLKGGKQFLEFIVLDIDIMNIRNIFRLRRERLHQDARALMIPGGSFAPDEFQDLIDLEDDREFIDALKKKIKVRLKPLLLLLDEMGAGKSIREIEIDLIRIQLGQMELLTKLKPFSIHPILTYLEKKKYEIFNLRALARGKEAELPTDRIRGYLVI
ncbi:MAG: V-type ATP synthase subunit C [Methanoregulaceae archaeon]|nr:V-type ATP synthase subunit C [Methanoregulaceae archaeon]